MANHYFSLLEQTKNMIIVLTIKGSKFSCSTIGKSFKHFMGIIVFQSQETKTIAGQRFTLKREAIALRNSKQIAPTKIPKSTPQIINLHNNFHKPTTLIYAYIVVNNYQITEFRIGPKTKP